MDFLISSINIFAVSGFFSCALYINLVEHPARMISGLEAAISQWPGSYKRAAVIQVSFAVVTIITSIWVWFLRRSTLLLLVPPVLMLSIIIYTIIFMLPTNKLLLKKDISKTSASTKALLDKWINMHTIRTILSFIAYMIILYYR